MGWRNLALDGEQCDAELYYLEKVDVTPYCLVVIRGFRVEVADGAGDYARKLGIL